MRSPHPVAPVPAQPALAALLSVLEHQRVVLERLQFVATTLRLLLATGDSRFLAPAADEHEALCDRLHTLEAMRAMHAEHVAERCGAPISAGLSELAAHLGADAAEQLRAAGRELARGIAELAQTQQGASGIAGALSERSAQVVERLSWGAPGGYSSNGAAAWTASGSTGTRSAAAPVWVDAGV